MLEINKKQVYKGYFHNGLKEGFGQIFFFKGGYFEGNFQNDKKNGYGILRKRHGE